MKRNVMLILLKSSTVQQYRKTIAWWWQTRSSSLTSNMVDWFLYPNTFYKYLYMELIEKFIYVSVSFDLIFWMLIFCAKQGWLFDHHPMWNGLGFFGQIFLVCFYSHPSFLFYLFIPVILKIKGGGVWFNIKIKNSIYCYWITMSDNI